MHPLFPLMTSLLLASGIFYVAALFSVILHELAHLTVLALHRVRVTDVIIGYGPRLFSCGRVVFRAWPIGGDCFFRSKAPLPVPTWGVLAVAGPLANLVLALGSLLLLQSGCVTGYPRAITVAVLYVNALFFYINAAAREESDGAIFWNYLSLRFTGTALSAQRKSQLNAGSLIGIFATASSFTLFEIMRGGLKGVLF